MGHDPGEVSSPRDRIGDGIGVLVQRRGLTVTDAFQLLLRWSNDTGMSIPDVADVVVRIGARDDGPDRDSNRTD